MAEPSTSEPTTGLSQTISLGMIANTVEPFTGKTNVRRYFEKLEQRAKLDGWDEKTTLNIIKYRLIGDAYNFFRTDPSFDDIGYKDFKIKFIKRFAPVIIPGQALAQLSNCRQRHDEDVSQFVMRLKLLGVEILDEDLRTAQPNEIAGMRKKVEQLILNQFKTGLRKELLKSVGATLMREANLTIDRAEELAKQDELNDLMINPRQPNNRVLNINRRDECYRCGKAGHFARDCWAGNNWQDNNYGKFYQGNRPRYDDRQGNYNRNRNDNFLNRGTQSNREPQNNNRPAYNQNNQSDRARYAPNNNYSTIDFNPAGTYTGAVPRRNVRNNNNDNGNQNAARALNSTHVSPVVPQEETW